MSLKRDGEKQYCTQCNDRVPDRYWGCPYCPKDNAMQKYNLTPNAACTMDTNKYTGEKSFHCVKCQRKMELGQIQCWRCYPEEKYNVTEATLKGNAVAAFLDALERQ